MGGVTYREGDWFAVPLRTDGYAVGVIARANPQGVLLGYFFGPRHPQCPTLDDVAALEPSDAMVVGQFGHLGIVDGTWPLLGQLDRWDRLAWPMPVFVRREELTGRVFRVFYDDDDPGKRLGEEQIPAGEAGVAPKDSLMGAGFTEKKLTKLLSC